MQPSSTRLSAIETACSLMKSEILPACLFCINNFITLQSALGSDDKNLVFEKSFFETPETETIIPDVVSNLINVRSRVDLLLGVFTWKNISFAKSYINLLSHKVARSTLQFFLVINFKLSPFKSNILPVTRKINKLSNNVTVFVFSINKSLTLFEFESFTSLIWLAFSGLVFSD